MTSRCILLIDGATKEQETALSKFLSGRGYGWWHRMRHVWLIVRKGKAISLVEIRDKVTEIMPEANVLVVRSEYGWAIHSPTKWHEWLRDPWKEPGSNTN